MAHDGGYDDPKLINAFLAEINAGAAVSSSVSRAESETQAKGDFSEQASHPTSRSDTGTPALTSAAASPSIGTRAPPPTPESNAVVATALKPLPSIDEDPDMAQVKFPLIREGESADPPYYLKATALSFHPPEAYENLARELRAEMVKKYHQDVHSKHKEDAQARIALADALKGAAEADKQIGGHEIVGAIGSLELSDPKQEASTNIDGRDDAMAINNESSFNASLVSNGTFHDAQDDLTAISETTSSSGDDSSVEIIVDAPKFSSSVRSGKSVIDITSPEKDSVKKYSPQIRSLVNEADEDAQAAKVEVEGPRADAIYFPTWGTPSNRTTSPARVRKVIISGLPASADFTFVQALIHGGAIEVMMIGPPSYGKVTAYVTFTTAGGCDLYYKLYPNGLEFRHNGKKHTVFVHKGKDVDVVSGVMQSSLDCGASRVIKVTGADEEWSMKALHNIAEGPDHRRKLETIVDSYRSDSRTILFRFTKISDAVAFRGHLLRSSDWEGVDISFGVDPCEKATGIHFE